jgi:antitoxin (DNA-binding transcriptional repressor) of toxin-antitoxin stability system
MDCATMCYMAQHPKPTQEIVGVRELRQNLSVYLARIARGASFRVTDRGQEVAMLVPLPPGTSTVERLIASGRATRPTRDLRSLGLPKHRARTSVMAALEFVREDVV